MGEIQVRELHPDVGAEITGLEPRTPLDEETIARLRDVFDERSILVFRDLDIDEDFQRYLVFALIGEEPPPQAPEHAAHRGPMLVSNKADGGAAPYGRLLFHCDTMWAESPQPIISLYGVHVVDSSAPTQFVSMGAAWDALPDELRARVADLQASHGQLEGGYPNRGGDDDVQDTHFDQSRSTVTPVARLHPRTGRPMLYVSQQCTIEILDLPEDEMEALLAELFGHLYAPDRVLEHHWREGDLVIWDNLAVQHGRGTVDLNGAERTLRKVFGPMTLTEAERGQLPTFSKVAKS
ncbi:MAG TPA: TauD/TfdA family dioxygenase [Acidimicrobiales bacterium]